MRLHALLPLLSLLPSTSALNILLNNDDGFASANLRLLYTHLLAANHSVLIVAPATQQSGQGGRTDFTVYKNLTAPSQYDIIPAGSPSLGTDPHDSNIWYYNGTPAACTFVALDYVLPRYYPGWVPDLALAGPNYGTNLGPFVMGLSGTVGATFAAVSRSVPAIALSASNKAVPYFNVTSEGHPAALAAKAAYHIVERFIDSTAPGGVVLPLGYGVNVNIPELDANGTLPPIIKSRLTGAAETDVAVYDEESGTFTWGNVRPLAAGVNACVNGECGLPAETSVVAEGGISVSVFTMDFDAPVGRVTDMVWGKVEGLFEGGSKVGGGYGERKRKRVVSGRDVLREE